VLASLVLMLAVALIPLALAAGQNLLVTAGPQIAVAVSFAAMSPVVARHRPVNPASGPVVAAEHGPGELPGLFLDQHQASRCQLGVH
jgi:hypothetical protein